MSEFAYETEPVEPEAPPEPVGEPEAPSGPVMTQAEWEQTRAQTQTTVDTLLELAGERQADA